MLGGQIREFNPHSEKSSYLERVQLYIEENGVEDGKKVADTSYRNVSKCYGLLKSLLAPVKPREETYDQLVETLKVTTNPNH